MYEPPVLDLDINAPEEFGNVAEKMSRDDRVSLASHLIEMIKIDESSMSTWLGEARQYLDEVCDPKNPMPSAGEQTGAGEDQMPPSVELTLSAVIQFSARATGQILSDPDLAKASNPDGAPLAAWVSSQLRTTDANWTVQTDPLIIHMAVTGLAWRKRAFDDYDKTFHSNFLTVEEVIVNANISDVKRAPRITHQFERYPYEIDRSIGRKHWIDFEPRYDDQDPQAPKKFYEVDLWIDLDGDDVDEPWTITLSRDDVPEVLRVRPRWSKKTIVNTKDALFFKPITRFFPYMFLPDPKGGFFPKGFGWLLSRVENSADRLLAAIHDTAQSASENGGVMTSSGFGVPDKIELKNNRVTVLPGERAIGDTFYPFQPKSVDSGTVAVLEKMITLGDRLAGTLNLLENAPASMTATMAKGIIDTGHEIQSAVHRRLVGSMTLEFRQFVQMADAYDMLPDGLSAIGPDGISVTADPSLATEMQRSALAGVYMQLMSDPLSNWKEVRLRLFNTLRLPDPEKLLGTPPQPPGMPETDRMKHAINAAKVQTDRIKTVAQVALALSQSIKNLVDAGGGMVDTQAAMLQMQQLETAMQQVVQGAQDAGAGLNGVDATPGNQGAGGAPPQGNEPSPEGVQGGASGGPGAAGVGGGLLPPGGLVN